MIELKSVKFINWHYLQESDTLPIGNTGSSCLPGGLFVTGSNKAGKSTLLDALQFACLVQTENFNQAANNDGTKRGYRRRDLTSYGRGMITMGEDSDEDRTQRYLREGRTTSHVLLEFQGNRPRETFVLGASLEFDSISGGEKEKNRIWWVADGWRIKDFTYFKQVSNGKVVLTVDELNKQHPIEKYDTKVGIKSALSYLFGLTAKKTGDPAVFDSWVMVMHSALLCDTKKMGNMDVFLREYVFPEYKVDTSHLDDLLDSIQNLSAEMDSISKNLAVLQELRNYYNLWEKANRDFQVSELQEKLLIYYKSQEDIQTTQSKIQGIAPVIQDAEHKLEVLDKQIRETNQTLGMLKGKYGARDKIKSQLDTLIQQIGMLTRKRDTFLNQTRQVSEFVGNVDTLGKKKLANTSLFDNLLCQTPAVTEEQVSKFVETLEEYSERFRFLKQEEQSKQKALQVQLTELSNEIDRLTRNEIGQERHRVIKRVISEAFQAAGIQGQPYFFCELLEWEDNSFCDAIEAYLNENRFNIIVPPEGYLIAAKAYRSYCQAHPDVFGVTVIDTRGYSSERGKCEPGSLAAAIKVENTLARNYLNDRFGRIMLVDDASDPKDKSKPCIDKTGMKYNRHEYTRLKPVRDLLIGQKARKELLKQRKREEERLKHELDASNSQLKELNSMAIGLFDQYRMNCLDTYLEIKELPSLESEKDKKKKRLEEYDRTPEGQQIVDMENELASLEKDRKAQQQALNEKQQLKQSLESYLHTCEEESKKIDISALRSDQPQDFDNAEDWAKKNLYRKNLALKELQTRKTKSISSKAANNGSIQSLEQQYVRMTEVDLGVGGVEDIAGYLDILRQNEQTDWPNLQAKLTQTKKTLNEQFKRSVLDSMHTAYERMMKTIRDLNYTLSQKPLNGTIFEFEKPKAMPGQEAIFDMISSENNVPDSGDQESMFANAIDNEFEEARAEFFRTLAACTTEREKDAVLDYRRYCKFRVIKKLANDPTKKEDLAAAYGINSGSENQVPCYIILAAALINRYNHGSRRSMIDQSDSIRLMIIDEAFNNMDEKNTKDLVRFLSKELGLQLIIAAPTDKLDRLGENVDHVWLVQGSEQDHSRVVHRFSYTDYQNHVNS